MTRSPPTLVATQAGFSLIEMLVVLAVAALAGSVIVMSSAGGQASVAAEADRLGARLLAARDLALAENRSVRVDFSAEGYRTNIRTRAGWEPVEGGLAFTAWGDSVSAAISEQPLPASLAFDPIGLSDPAAIRLMRGARAACVHVDGGGNVRRGAEDVPC